METLTQTPSMHRSLGSATLSQLAFPQEGNPNFLWEKFHRDNTVAKVLFFYIKAITCFQILLT